MEKEEKPNKNNAPNTRDALEDIFKTKEAPKPEQLDKMTDSWGKIRNPKKK